MCSTMLITVYLTIQLIRKAIGIIAFLLAAFALLFTMAMGELINWVATEPLTGMRRYCAESIADAWRFFVYNPKH